MCIWFSRSIIIWLLVGLWHIKEELRKGFFKFSNKFPKHFNKKERRSYHSNHISNVNYLDKHVFLRIFVHKHQDDKHGIKHMQAKHRNMWSMRNTMIHLIFEFDFSGSELNSFKLMNQGELRGRGCTYYLSWRRWGSKQWWFSQTTM